jgi:hypothetical protein
MVRHEVQFVLRFGVFDEFRELLDRLRTIELRHAWAAQRCWRATGGRMNEMVIEHEYVDRNAYDAQRASYHDAQDGDFATALAALAELMVPGTATETVREELP